MNSSTPILSLKIEKDGNEFHASLVEQEGIYFELIKNQLEFA